MLLILKKKSVQLKNKKARHPVAILAYLIFNVRSLSGIEMLALLELTAKASTVSVEKHRKETDPHIIRQNHR